MSDNPEAVIEGGRLTALLELHTQAYTHARHAQDNRPAQHGISLKFRLPLPGSAGGVEER